MSSDYLRLSFVDALPPRNQDGRNCKNRMTPFAHSQIYFAPIESAQELTSGEDVKTVYRLALNITDIEHDFQPGDSIGILPQNDEILVRRLLVRLNIESVADQQCKLHVSSSTIKKNPTIPKHLPIQTTLRDIFSSHVDIHTPPKKLFLKSLARFVTDPQELEKIQQLCAPKASQEYTDLIAGAGATLLGLLDTFPSCQPPVEIILENVPPLQPRFYSISSSPLESNKIEITFFVVVHNDGRKGVCTGWLQRLIQNKTGDLVPFYFRQPTKFRLATEPPPPTILIATGTGIAPFRGFLQHRSLLGGDHERIWLFYGCRYPDRDYLYKKDIDSYLQQGVLTKLDLAFSREGENKNYVQHNIDRHGVEFVDWLLKIDAQLFVCGDAKTVQKDVKAAIINNLIKHGCMSEAGADDFVRELESRAKFVVDAWL